MNLWLCFTFPGPIFRHDWLTLCPPTMRDFTGINKLSGVWEIESIPESELPNSQQKLLVVLTGLTTERNKNVKP